MRWRKILIRALAVFAAVVIGAGIFVSAVFRANYVAPIIMYHYIADVPEPTVKDPLLVTAKTFERQMRFLKQHHYNVLPLEEMAALIRQKRKLPPRAIAITFDDGYKDNFTLAFPVLKKYQLPAAIFLIVDEIGARNRLSWEEIMAMQDSGLITFGSHTLGPDPLVKIKSEAQLRNQIFASKRILEEKLGRQVDLFSYPEGMFNALIRQMVIDAGYCAAVATHPGKSFPSDDVFALKRLRISENCRNMFIFSVETSGYYTFMKENKRKHRNGKK